MKKAPTGCIMVIATMVAFFASVYGVAQLLSLSWHEPTVPTCDGREMTIVDSCDLYRNGYKSSSSDYKSQLAADVFGHYVGVYAVALAIAAGVWALVGIAVYIWRMERQPSQGSDQDTESSD